MRTPLAKRVAEQIKQEIVNGAYSSVTRLQPERELCAKFKVSRPTLRTAFLALEKEGLITRIPRRGIEVVAQGGQHLKDKGKSATRHVILWCRPSQSSTWMRITEGVQRRAKELGLDLHVVDCRNTLHRNIDAIEHPPHGVTGSLLVPFGPGVDKAIIKAKEDGLKIVFVDQILPSVDISSVSADHFSGGYSATHHLIENHDRPVYHVSYRNPSSSSRERRRGWVEAMEEHGFGNWQAYFVELPRDEPEVAVAPDGIQQDACRVMKGVFAERKQDKYSILAVGDKAAMGIYRAAGESSLTVGKDVFIVGSYNLPLCERMVPPLSSVEHYPENVGYEAASLLYNELTGRSGRPVHKVLPVNLKIRASSIGNGTMSNRQTRPLAESR